MAPDRMPINWFQAVLLIILLILLGRWIYNRYFSDQRRATDEPIAREESAITTETREEIPEADKPVVSPPIEEKIVPAERKVLKEQLPEGVQVTYPVDFSYTSKRGEARFLYDPESGAHVWVSGGFPQEYLSYQGGMRNGMAHGEGEATFRVMPTDHSPLQVQGQFRDGIFMGNHPFPNQIIALLPVDFLIHLSSLPENSAELWFHQGFQTDGLELSLDNRGYEPDLLVIAPEGLSAIEEETIKDLMKKAYEVYCSTCQPIRGAWVHIVPKNYVSETDGSRTKFVPEMARAQVVGGTGDEVRFFSYQNPEAEAANQRKRAKEREEVKKREQEMGPLRGRPDVRGVRLGMRVEEAWEVLKNEIDEWEGPRETPGEDRRYVRPLLKIRFKDGARMKAEFCSRVSGSQLFLISYEQYYREGVPLKVVIDKLEEKYGKPDDVHTLSSGTRYASYGLVSAITPPDTAFGPGGAFFKTGVTARHKTRFAETLTIVFNDATLGYHDEAAIHDDRKEAARREFEENKSDKVNF